GHGTDADVGPGPLVGVEHEQELHSRSPLQRGSLAPHGNVGRGEVISTGRAENSGAAMPPGLCPCSSATSPWGSGPGEAFASKRVVRKQVRLCLAGAAGWCRQCEVADRSA